MRAAWAGAVSRRAEAFERALQTGAQAASTLVAHGDVLRELGRPDDALADYQRALQLNGDCVEALRGRGDALLDMGEPQSALAVHDRATALGPR